jgi:hypothetical protein
MDNYVIVIDGENPHAELLKKRGEASLAGDVKVFMEVQAELEKLGFPKFSAEAIQYVHDNARRFGKEK